MAESRVAHFHAPARLGTSKAVQIPDYTGSATRLFADPILKVTPLSEHGNALEIAGKFGGPKPLRAAVEMLQMLLYAV